MRLALFEPDIPANTGTLIRMGACLGLTVDIIEPCGFLFSSRDLKRATMDYASRADIARWDSWDHFLAARPPGRQVLVETDGTDRLWDFAFLPGDTLLMGRESAGVPDAVRAACDASVHIPMVPGARSLNVALAAAMVCAEAMRQLGAPQTKEGSDG
jgi:tRNA (cytidine/uridine-2'-O-)-methyltransferase